MQFTLSLILCLLLTPWSLWADDSSEVNQKALEQTMDLLKNAEQRQKVIDKSDSAQRADKMANQVMGSEQGADELYDASSQIFRNLAESTGGDSKQMEAILSEAMKNPEGFLKSLSAQDQQLIKQLGEKAAQDKAKP